MKAPRRAQRGRPPTSRNKRLPLNLRLPPEELAAVREAAQASGQPVASWITTTIVRAARKQTS